MQNDLDDKEFLKELFDKETVEVPKELEPEAVVNGLVGGSGAGANGKSKRIKRRYKFIAAAAAVLLCAMSVVAIDKITGGGIISTTKMLGGVEDSYYNRADNNYKDLFAYIKKSGKKLNSRRNNMLDKATNTEAIKSAQSSTRSDINVSKTNAQSEGVDEADIIKTDGGYIYAASQKNHRTVRIIKADGGELETAASIRLKPNRYVSEMFLFSGKLVVIAEVIEVEVNDSEYVIDCLGGHSSSTEVDIYNIEDRKAPVLMKKFTQDGSYVSSRIAGGNIYTVTSNAFYSYKFDQSELDRYVPKVVFGSDKNNKLYVKSGDIHYDKSVIPNEYTVLTNYDLNTMPEKAIDTAAVFSSTSHIYATKNSFYTLSDIEKGNGYDTYIVKFDILNKDLDFVADKTVDGMMLNQFSADEYDGYLRVASTKNMYSDSTECVLTVLDSSLKQVSKLDHLAKGERIYSARFEGENAYLVTFKETDPLFSISLADPANPKVLGKLKIPGYSDYMHPVGDDLMIGIGSQGNYAKISLFDVSDKTNPKELDKIIVNRGEIIYSLCQVSYTHKAFTFLEDKKTALLPFYISHGSYIGERYNFMAIEIKNKKLSVAKVFEESSYVALRSVRIDDCIYLMNASNITSYDLNTFTKKGRLKI